MKAQGNAAAAAVGSPDEGERKNVNTDLWHACAGPLVTIPAAGSLVVYFPQGHSEQVAASMRKDVNAQMPNYPNLPSKLICILHNVTLHVDPETDEVYAQMTLQPVHTNNKEAVLASDLSLKPNKPQPEFFCKTLTASDTSTHGGFSVPRRAAEKIFPPLDFSMQPPSQELQARDLHDNVWTFRHIYRGQPKRHLLTTGWSLFVSGKRLLAGDSVLFIRDEKSQLLLGIRRANRQPTNLPSSVLSSDSMHIGILAAAAYAAANNSPFTVFYNPRTSPSEFVIPLAKYNKAIYSNHMSLGMRFRMMFETEDSGTRRYMGTITGISDLDPVRWKNSHWRNLQVGWDESVAGERRNRVSLWEIEPVIAPFFICPSPFFGSKRQRQPDEDSTDIENIFKRVGPWLGEDVSIKDSYSQSAVMPGLSLAQWMNMQQSSLLGNSNMQPLAGPGLQNIGATDLSRQLGLQSQILQQNSIQFGDPSVPQQVQQLDQLSKLPTPPNQLGTITKAQQLQDVSLQQRQHLMNQTCSSNQTQRFLTQPQVLVPNQVQQQLPPQQQTLLQTPQPSQPNLPLNQPQQLPLQQQQQLMHQQQLQSKMPVQIPPQINQQLQLSEQQIQLLLLQKLHHQQQSLQQQQQQQSILPKSPLQQPQSVHEQHNMVSQALQVSNSHSLYQQDNAQQHIANNSSMIMQYSQPLQQQAQQKPQHQQTTTTGLPGLNYPASLINQVPPPGAGSSFPASGGAQSVITNDVPSCSTSPSTNGPSFSQNLFKNTQADSVAISKTPYSAPANLSMSTLENPLADIKTDKKIEKCDNQVKPSVCIPKAEPLTVAAQTYLGSVTQVEYLDTSSSTTSNCLSQSDAQLQQSLPFSFNQPPMFRDTGLAVDAHGLQTADPRNNVLFGVSIDDPLAIPLSDPSLDKNLDSGKDCSNSFPPVNMVGNYGAKEAQEELSSSFVSRSFGVPDVAFDPIDSTINDSGLLNKCSWAPPPQIQRMRTYTKVYKRGAVGRSIDITRYSGYDELKQDLSRMFSMGGQIEDLQRAGWKLVYVDHENDVLLVGDDPWEEFVGCVRCIRILSPQEVQQMSLEGCDLGNNVLPNQACSSSDGGNGWRGQCDQNPANPSAVSYDRFQ